MGIHYGIIADFLNTKSDPAFFDIGAAFGTQATFTVLQPTGNLSQTKPFVNGFATSDDLFTLSGSGVSLPAMVMAATKDTNGNDDGMASLAILRQKKLILASAAQSKGFLLGTAFGFPLGDLGSTSGGGSGAHLLVGNPSGSGINGQYSTSGLATPFTVDPLS